MTCPVREFASLHNHTHYSVFDGLSLPEELLQAASDKGLKSIALTDHGVLHGHGDWFVHGKKLGVRAIFGMEAYVIHDLEEWRQLRERISVERREKDKKDHGVDDKAITTNARLLRRKGHLVLLATSRDGLANLNSLSFDAHKHGFYSKPRMDKRMLRDHRAGLVATSACMGGVVSKALWDLKDGTIGWADVVREALEYDEIFGRGRFFLELQFNEMDEAQNYINEALVKIHRQTGIPLTVTTDSHYTKSEEWEAREVLHLLGWSGGKTVAELPGGKIDTEIKQLYVKSAEEMWATYERYGGQRIDRETALRAFEGPLVIDGLVEQFEPDTTQRLPTLPYPNPFAEMGQRAIGGLKRLGLAGKVSYKERLLHELTVIKEKGFANYFLIVQGIVEEAKKHMLVGAGRGSAAGSLVCYALGITDLDPVKYDLMFERFMDPARVENPDIDIDFEDSDAAKEMLRGMFGEDNVASLSTYNTFQVKGLLKDVARIYALDHNEVNVVNKRIQAELKALYVGQDKSTIVIKLEDVQRVSPTFNRFVEENPQVGRHLVKLYGRIRHVGRHAAGVVIGDRLPAETSIFTSKGVVQASLTEGIVGKRLSEMGMVKFDILGLATLKVVNRALRLVAKKNVDARLAITGVCVGRSERRQEEVRGEVIERTQETENEIDAEYERLKESIRPHNLDLDDPRVMRRIFWDGNFAGVFTFTEKGIRRLAQRVKPDTFEDVSAITSLYRPGPLGSGMDKLFVQNKHDPSKVKYEHPLLENILKRTRGCIVYQEQLMQICNAMGKMSWKDVNRVRKVLLKKDKSKTPEFLAKENDELEGKFVAGCVENGLTEQRAKELFTDLKFFGGYGFNMSHSHSYAILTMQCAHLATYHPLEFYSAVLTCGQAAEMQSYVDDIRRAGVRVLPVDINASRAAHVVEGDGVRLSLSCVKGLGPKAIQKVLEAQPYASFRDYLERCKANKAAHQALVACGAFTDLEPNLGLLIKRLDLWTSDKKLQLKKNRVALDSQWDALADTPDVDVTEKMALERTFLEFNVRESPFGVRGRSEKIKRMLDEGLAISYQDLVDSDEAANGMVPVLLKEWKERPQRNGQMFAFLKLATEEGQEFEAPCFSTVWRHVSGMVQRGECYALTLNKPEEGDGLIVGKPGFMHSAAACVGYFLRIDDVEI